MFQIDSFDLASKLITSAGIGQFKKTSSDVPGRVPPAYCTPNPVPNVPENNKVRLLDYRGSKLAAFTVEGRDLICLPQAFELFLKHLVGGLHTVYTKLKRLEITPVVCNVEQVRILRGLGAIQPGVNRCKLIAPYEFDILYADCTNSSARPGRPSKRSSELPVNSSGYLSTPTNVFNGNSVKNNMNPNFNLTKLANQEQDSLVALLGNSNTTAAAYLAAAATMTVLGIPSIHSVSRFFSQNFENSASSPLAADFDKRTQSMPEAEVKKDLSAYITELLTSTNKMPSNIAELLSRPELQRLTEQSGYNRESDKVFGADKSNDEIVETPKTPNSFFNVAFLAGQKRTFEEEKSCESKMNRAISLHAAETE